jgi:hypothetical protein
MTEREAAPGGGTPPLHFTATVHEELDDRYRPLGGADPWYWAPPLAEGDPVNERIDTVQIPGLFSGTEPAQVRVHLRGVSDCIDFVDDHLSRVILRNDLAEDLASDDGTFEGFALFLHDFGWSHQSGQPELTGSVDVVLQALDVNELCPPNLTSDVRNDFYLDWIEIDYQRSFEAIDDTLVFDWPDGDADFEIGGLASSAVDVYEITERIGDSDVIDAVRLTGVGVEPFGQSFRVTFRMDNDPALADGTLRRFVVSGTSAIQEPAAEDVEIDTVSDLRSTAIQADIVVIVALRAAAGMTSKIARLDDVEDEFNDGLPGPLAIKRFLTWVMSEEPGEGWAAPKPSFVILLGDASFDYKAGTASGTYVPTQIMFKENPILGYYASDNVMAAVVGADAMPDLILGRITARSAAEANAILIKILDYEQATPPGPWQGHALLVSDRGKNFDDIEAEEFERINDIAADAASAPPHSVRKIRYWTDVCQGQAGLCNPTTMNLEIKDAVNGLDEVSDGAAIMQFIGHGNFDLWSDDVIFCANEESGFCLVDDTAALDNDLKLPWMIVHNCLTGGFHADAEKSFGEQWLKRGRGGAVAVYAPSGLGFRFLGEAVTETVWGDVFGPNKERVLGLPVLSNLADLCQDSIEACQYYVLLGDPSMRLVIPAPDPPTDVVATAGNAEVTLDWTLSPSAVAGYDVYRANDAGGSYAKLTTREPTAGPSYTDTTAENAQDYFYYVVAVDADGFESRWSNFNSDCGVQGPDCVTAMPLNPFPPAAPQGLVVQDAESGGKLDVAWTPNGESDVRSYTVHYGLAPGDYTVSLDTFATAYAITGLDNGTIYYVAVTATNTSGNTSGFSDEGANGPNQVRGIKAPAFISDLHVDKAGNDALLQWSAVTTDIYGKEDTIAQYEVYRGTEPGFLPVPGNRIGVTGTPSFSDAGALADGEPAYHYLVRAVDVDGHGGGLARQLPGGIADLILEWTPETTTLTLSWSPVGGDFDGSPAVIDHYEVYASDQPIARADVCDGLDDGCAGLEPVLDDVGGASAQIVEPGATNRYYSVLAVDAKGNKSPF